MVVLSIAYVCKIIDGDATLTIPVTLLTLINQSAHPSPIPIPIRKNASFMARADGTKAGHHSIA
jgi:hypothetical protein